MACSAVLLVAQDAHQDLALRRSGLVSTRCHTYHCVHPWVLELARGAVADLLRQQGVHTLDTSIHR